MHAPRIHSEVRKCVRDQDTGSCSTRNQAPASACAKEGREDFRSFVTQVVFSDNADSSVRRVSSARRRSVTLVVTSQLSARQGKKKKEEEKEEERKEPSRGYRSQIADASGFRMRARTR